jgi:hypothetical protein
MAIKLPKVPRTDRSFSHPIDTRNTSALDALTAELARNKISFERVNDSRDPTNPIANFKMGSGDFEFVPTDAIRITQNINNERRTSYIFSAGASGGLFTANEENRSSFRPVMPLAMLQDSGVEVTSPIDRIVQAVSHPFSVNRSGRQTALTTLLGEQGGSPIAVGRWMNQPSGLDRIYSSGYQLGGDPNSHQSLVDILNRGRGSDPLLRYAGVGMASSSSAYRDLGPVGRWTDKDGMHEGILQSSIKRFKLGTGDIGGLLSRREGNLNVSQETFYAENQSEPNWGYSLRGRFDMFSNLPEGQGALDKQMYAFRQNTRTINLSGSELDASGQIIMNGRTLTKDAYFGSNMGRATKGLTKIGGANDFRETFGIGMGNVRAAILDSIEPIFDDRGNYTHQARIGYRGVTENMSIKQGGLKLSMYRTGEDLGDADFAARFPEQKELPAFAMQVLHGQMRNTGDFETWFMENAQRKGKSLDWAIANINNGQVSAEAMPIVASGAVDFVMNQMRPVQKSNVELTPMQYEAMQGATFTTRMSRKEAKMLGATRSGWKGEYTLPVIPNTPGNVETLPNGNTLVRTQNDLRLTTEISANARPEFQRNTMRVGTYALNLMSQYNPELFEAMNKISETTRKKSGAYNIVSSYRANYEPEQMDAVKKTFGIANIDLAKVKQMQLDITTGNPDMPQAAKQKLLMEQLAKEYGSQSLNLALPNGQNIVLPAAGATGKSMTVGRDGNIIQSWGTRVADLIGRTAAGDATSDELSIMAEDALLGRRGRNGKRFGGLEQYTSQAGVIEKANSITVPRLGGFAYGASGIAVDEIVASREHMMRITGLGRTDIDDMAATGTLAAAVLRYPASNPQEMTVNQRIKFWEDMPDEWKQAHPNPRQNILMSPDAMAAIHGDFDADRVMALVNATKAGASSVFGGILSLKSPGEILSQARNKIESEYTKQLEVFQSRRGINPREVSEFFNDPNNLFKLKTNEIAGAFTAAEQGGKGSVGLIHNALLARYGNAVNTSTEGMGLNPQVMAAQRKALGVFASYGQQALLDTKERPDAALQRLVDISSFGYRSPSGKFSIFNPSKGGTMSTDLESGEENYFAARLRDFTLVGANMTNEEYDRSGMADSLAAQVVNRNYMDTLANRGELDTHLDKVSRIIRHGKVTGEDVTSQVLALTGAGSYAEWGEGKSGDLSSLSAGAQWIAGSNAAHGFNAKVWDKTKQGDRVALVDPATGKPLTKGVYPEGGNWEAAGNAYIESEEFRMNAEKMHSGGLEGTATTRGGTGGIRSFIRSMLPGSGAGKDAWTESMTVRREVAGMWDENRLLNPSEWSFGASGADDKLMRAVMLNTDAGARRSEILKMLKDRKEFVDYSPFTGGGGGSGGNNAADIGKAMENTLLNAMGESATLGQIPTKGNADARTGKGSIDTILSVGGKNVLVDVKTKSAKTINEVMSGQVDAKIAGQLSLYMQAREEAGDPVDSAGIIFGLRPTTGDPMDAANQMASFAETHAEAMTFFSNPTAPAGMSQADWDVKRTSSIQLMNDIEAEYGVKVGATTFTAKEGREFLANRTKDAATIPALNRSMWGGTSEEHLQQILDIVGGKTPHVRTGGGSGGGGDDGSGGNPAADPAANGPTPGTFASFLTGAGGGTTINNYAGGKLSMPSLGQKEIENAAVAMKNLSEAAKGLVSPMKDVRKEFIAHFDAISKVVSYSARVEQFKKTQGADAMDGDPEYEYYKANMVSALPVMRQFVRANQQARIEAGVMNAEAGDGEEVQGGVRGGINRLLDRTIKGQGLFHAKMAWNMFGGTAFKAAEEYQTDQAMNAMSLYQSGSVNYGDLMSGSYGTVARRGAMMEQAHLGFGQQVMRAYQPLVNFAMSPGLAQGPLGAAAGIGLPAAGAGMAAASLFGGPAGWAAAGMTALAGAAGYGYSSMNPQGALEQYELGKAYAGKPSTFAGDLGRTLGDSASQLGQTFTLYSPTGTGYVQAPYAQVEQMAQQYGYNIPGTYWEVKKAQQSRDTALGIESVASGLLAGQTSSQMAQQFPAVNMGDAMIAAFNERSKQAGVLEGVGADNMRDIMSQWMTYSTQIPDINTMKMAAGNWRAGIDPRQLAMGQADAMGYDPYNMQGMYAAQLQQGNDVFAAQQRGLNPAQFVAERMGSFSSVSGANQLLRQAQLPQFDPNRFSWIRQTTNIDVARNVVGAWATGAQTRIQNPDYYDQFGQAVQQQAEDAYLNYDYEGGRRYESNLAGGVDMFTKLQANRAAPNVMQREMSAYYSFRTASGQYQRDQMLSGNRWMISKEAQRNGIYDYQTINPDSGMSVYYEGVGKGNIDVLRNNGLYALPNGGAMDMFRLTDAEAAYGTRGYSAQITATGRAQETRQYWNNAWRRDANWAVQTGNMGQAAQNFQALGMGFNPGNGMGMWQLEDAQRTLGRSQQMFDYNQGSRQLQISEQSFELSGRQFQANYGLSERRFGYNTQYQRREMGIQQGQTVEQQGWQQEDLSYSRSRMDIGFAWQMQDADRNIRYARGREKLDLMRQKERAVISYSMEAGQADRQQERHDKTVQWQQEEFERRKQHFEETTKFQREEMDNQKRFFEEGRQLERQRMDLQQEAHRRQLFMMQEQWRLEDQRIHLQRQNETLAYNNQVQMDTLTRQTTLEIQKWQDALQVVSDTTNEQNTFIDVLIQKGELLWQLVNKFLNLQTGSVGIPGGPDSGVYPPGIPQPGGGNPGGPTQGGNGGTSFPSNPYVGQTHVVNGKKYQWTGSTWKEWVVAGAHSTRPNMGVIDPSSGITPIEARGGIGLPSNIEAEDEAYKAEIIRLLTIIASNPTTFNAVVQAGKTPGSPYLAGKARI